MAYVNSATATSTGVFANLGSALNNLITRYKQYRLYRLTFDGLSDLTDMELSDLGLSRSELRSVAIKAVYN